MKNRPSCWHCSQVFEENGPVSVQPSAAATVPVGSAPISAEGVPPLPTLVASTAAGVPELAFTAGTGFVPPAMPMPMTGWTTSTPPLPQTSAMNQDAGPRIQGGYITRPAGPPHQDPVPQIPIHTPRSQSSSDSDSGQSGSVSQMPNPGDYPTSWLLPGETEDKVYDFKHLKLINITRLPTDAASCREWRAALLAAISRVDKTSRDVLVKYATFCMDGGRGKRFRRQLQADAIFVAFNKHLAAELIKTEVLQTNSDLAHEITSFVEHVATLEEGPRGAAILNIISGYYETGLSRSVALNQMHLLTIQLNGKGQKELVEFVRKVNYVLHGLKDQDRPSPATLFQWLWHQVKRVPMLNRVTDKIR